MEALARMGANGPGGAFHSAGAASRNGAQPFVPSSNKPKQVQKRRGRAARRATRAAIASIIVTSDAPRQHRCRRRARHPIDPPLQCRLP